MTKLIGFGRGTLKTTTAILESFTTGRRIICCDRKRADFTSKFADQLGYNIQHPLSVWEFLQNRDVTKTSNGIIIDDVEDVLRQLFNQHIATITFNGTKMNPWDNVYVEGIENKIDEIIDRKDFLENEVKRCYKEIEQHEIDIDRLTKERDAYMAAYQRQVWREMKGYAFSKKNRRKFNNK